MVKPVQTGLHYLVPIGSVHPHEQTVAGDAGIVDDDINAVVGMLLLPPGELSLRILLVTHIEAEKSRFTAQLRNSLSGFRCRLFVGLVINQYGIVEIARQGDADGPANPP